MSKLSDWFLQVRILLNPLPPRVQIQIEDEKIRKKQLKKNLANK